MSIELDRLTGIERTVVMDFFGEQVTFVYRPGAGSADNEMKRVRLSDLERATESLSEKMVSWDVVYNGKPLQPTKKVLMSMPVPLIAALVTAILEDMKEATEQLQEEVRFLQLMNGVLPDTDEKLQ